MDVADQHEIGPRRRDACLGLGEAVGPFGGGRPGGQDLVRHPMVREGQRLGQAAMGDARAADRARARDRDDGERRAGPGRRPAPQEDGAADPPLGLARQGRPVGPRPARTGCRPPRRAGRRDRARRGRAPCRHRARAGPPPPRPRSARVRGRAPSAPPAPACRPRAGRGSRRVPSMRGDLGAVLGVILALDRGQGLGRGVLRDQHADRRPRPSVRQTRRADRASRGGREGPTRDAACRRRNCARTRHVRFATRSQRHCRG